MNRVFKYNINAKYLNKDLRGEYNGSDFLLLDVYLNDKAPSVKIKLLNIFKDHHNVAKLNVTAVGYDEWALFNALWMKFCSNRGKYKPELKKYFHMYQCQLHFAMFCVTGAFGISRQHLNHPNLHVHSVDRFHVYFYVQIIMHHLAISLPHEDDFSKVKNSYIKKAYYSICDDCGVNADETWMDGDWFCTTKYGDF